jgi:thioesterase domain-containing protein
MSAFEPEETVQSRARMEVLINCAFKREVIRKVTDVILPLNDDGCGPAFYCVHAIGGVATVFQHMARMLGPKQQFYGIQAPTDKRNAEFVSSIKSISQHYVDELVKFQPEGPFFLGGHSVGATIALEMSQQLIARGREVSLLVVFDGGLLNTGAEISFLNPLYWLRLLCYLPRWITYLLVVKYTFQSFCRMIANKAEKLSSRHAVESSSRHAVESVVNLSLFTTEHTAFMKGLYDRHLEYVPNRYSGRVLVFVAKFDELMNHGQVKAAWKKIAPSSEIFEVYGTHGSIIEMPHGVPVAERLSEKIKELAPTEAALSPSFPKEIFSPASARDHFSNAEADSKSNNKAAPDYQQHI